MNKALMMVFGKDRPGIIAKITGLLFKNGCNLEDISMTLLEGEFAMLVILSYDKGKRKAIFRQLDRLKREWMLFSVWREVTHALKRGEKHPPGCQTYLISVFGKDRTGIVYHTSKILADYGLNITDLNSKILGQGKNAIYAMMLEVDIPKKLSRKILERSLRALKHKLHIDLTFKAVESLEL